MDELIQKYKQACEKIFLEIREMRVPRATGNMADHALQYRWEGENGLTFHMFMDEDIAPYTVYTNEPWEAKFVKMGNFKKGQTIYRYRSWKNPNEHWWNFANEYFMRRLAEELKGELR